MLALAAVASLVFTTLSYSVTSETHFELEVPADSVQSFKGTRWAGQAEHPEELRQGQRRRIIIIAIEGMLIFKDDNWGSFTAHPEVSSLGPEFAWKWDFAGVIAHRNALGGILTVGIPGWYLVALFAIYPFSAFIRGPVRRLVRRRRGACVRCGYSLTGNEFGICPACGTETDP